MKYEWLAAGGGGCGGKRGGAYTAPMVPPLWGFLGEHVAAGLDGAEDLVADDGADDGGHVAVCEGGGGRGGVGRHGRAGAAVGLRRDEVEGFLDEALGEAAVGEGERRQHDLAGRVVEVGVGDEGAEAEDLAGAALGRVDAGVLLGRGVSGGGGGVGSGGGRYLDVADASEIHHGAAEGAEGVLDVKSEADALAEEELAGQYLLGGLSAKVFDEAAGGLVVPPVYPRNARRTR